MRLELRWSEVDALVAGPATALSGRRLTVDLDGLRALLEADPRLGRVQPRPRAPGRGVPHRPRVRRGAPRGLGSAARTSPACSARSPRRQRRHAGPARRRRGRRPTSSSTTPRRWRSSTCRGRWRRSSEFGRTANLVISATPAAGAGRGEYQAALRLAALRAAVHLARAAGASGPTRSRCSTCVPRAPAALEHLPRVAYVFQIHSHQRPTGIDEGILYGDPVRRHAAHRRSIPTRCSMAPCCAASWGGTSRPTPPRTIR